MTITTKWNKLFDWRLNDVSPTDVLSSIKTPAICILSAPAFGLKGYLPGGRHTWIAQWVNGTDWTVIEISDIETLEYQGGKLLYNKYYQPQLSQLIASDRDPTQMWFGRTPRLDRIYPYSFIFEKDLEEYPLNKDITLTRNNCNTFVSFMSWKYGWDANLPYVGYKPPEYWDNLCASKT